MTMTANASSLQAGMAGRASGAQLIPLAQQLAQQISTGQIAMPSTTEGWQNLVAQFSTNAQNLNLNGVARIAGSLTTQPSAGTQPSATPPSTAPAATPTPVSTSGGTGQVDQFLSAVRQHESGGNYQAYNVAGGASGAYQYIQSTWTSEARSAGFPQWANVPAGSAPPAVQDAVAKYNALNAYNSTGSWKGAAETWYYPAWAGDASKQGQVPYPSAGNTETIGAYGDQIVSMMGQQGKAPANNAPANNGVPTKPTGGSQAALNFAQSQIGANYQWGGQDPNAPGHPGNFDCSGLAQAAYKAAGVNLPRVAQAQYDATMKVPQGQALQVGDLVFYGSSAKNITHVGIYIGNNQMIDAPNSGSKVRVDNYQWGDYVGATRPSDNTGATMLPNATPPGSRQPTQQVTQDYGHVLSQVMSALNSGAR